MMKITFSVESNHLNLLAQPLQEWSLIQFIAQICSMERIRAVLLVVFQSQDHLIRISNFGFNYCMEAS